MHLPGKAIAALAATCIWQWPPAQAAPSAASKGGPRAEVQIGLCAPQADMERAFGLHQREAPYEVWQFDDAALTLLEHGLRLRLRIQAAQSQLTLKIADQKCDALPEVDVVPVARQQSKRGGIEFGRDKSCGILACRTEYPFRVIGDIDAAHP